MHCHGLLDIFIFETIEHNKMKDKAKYATVLQSTRKITERGKIKLRSISVRHRLP